MVNQSGKRTADFILKGGDWKLCEDALSIDTKINTKKHQKIWDLNP